MKQETIPVETPESPLAVTKAGAKAVKEIAAMKLPDEAIQEMTLAEKLLRIEAEMPEIQKTGQNVDKAGKVQYEFVEQQTIMHAVRPLLIKYGILVIPRVIEHKLHNKQGFDTRANAEVGKGVKVVASMEFVFINTHDREDILTIPWTAEGDDYGDKGTNKATTIAQKNMYIRLFNIADTDPDATSPAEASIASPDKPAPVDKHTIIFTMLKRLKMSPEEFEKGLKKPIEKMTNAEADDSIARMEAVIARQNAQEAAGIEAQQ